MHLHGLVQSAELAENPPGGDRIEMILRVQGVGPGQPRKIVVPHELLLQDPDIEPELVVGHAFEAEVVEDGHAPNRWVTLAISFASRRVLRADPE
jgi:hypothetical protein